MKGVDAETLRAFYRSNGADFAKFQLAMQKRASPSTIPPLPNPPSTAPAPAKPATPPSSESPVVSPPDGVQRGSLRPVKGSKRSPAPAAPSASAAVAAAASDEPHSAAPTAASGEYMGWLRKVQELNKLHVRASDQLAAAASSRKAAMDATSSAASSASALLAEIEAQRGFGTAAAYDAAALARDCQLTFPLADLAVPGAPPRPEPARETLAALARLRSEDAARGAVFRGAIDGATRRVERIAAAAAATSADVAAAAAVPFGAIAAVGRVVAGKTVEEIVTPLDDAVQSLLARARGEQALREVAVQDGEMATAEGHFYAEAAALEAAMRAASDKLGGVEAALAEAAAGQEVRDADAVDAAARAAALKAAAVEQRGRCESDVAAVLALRARVDEAEKAAQQRAADAIKRSDTVLADTRLAEAAAWAKLSELEGQLAALGAARHAELRRRVEHKEKDELRAAEHARFCAIAEAHCQALDATARDLDAVAHAADLAAEAAAALYAAATADHTQRRDALVDAARSGHGQALAAYRALVLVLTDLVHRKERRGDDITRQIQAAHMQLELAADALDPTAKRFSEARRAAVAAREAVDREIAALQARLEAAAGVFAPSGLALRAAGIDFVDPTEEATALVLETRAKMVEYKAQALGTTAADTRPLAAELEAVKRQLGTTRALVEATTTSALLLSLAPSAADRAAITDRAASPAAGTAASRLPPV